MNSKTELNILQQIEDLNIDTKETEVFFCIDDMITITNDFKKYLKILFIKETDKMPLKEFEKVCNKLNIKYKLFKTFDARKTK